MLRYYNRGTEPHVPTDTFHDRYLVVQPGAEDGSYLQLFFLGFSFSILQLFDEETVVAALFQLHNDV